MSTDQIPEQAWGAPDPSARRWGLRVSLVAVGVAVVIAGFGGAAIYAATDSGGHSPGHGMAGGPPPGGFDGGPGFSGAHPLGPGGPTLHGEFVASDGAGGYATVLTQTGTVTAVTPTAVTVRSADDFTQTYRLSTQCRRRYGKTTRSCSARRAPEPPRR